MHSRVGYNWVSICCSGYSGDAPNCERTYMYVRINQYRRVMLILYTAAICQDCDSPRTCIAPGVCACPDGSNNTECLCKIISNLNV